MSDKGLKWQKSICATLLYQSNENRSIFLPVKNVSVENKVSLDGGGGKKAFVLKVAGKGWV